MIGHRMQSASRAKPARVVSLSEHRAALEKTYPGFEGKVLVFDETVALGAAQLVELVDIRQSSSTQRESYDE